MSQIELFETPGVGDDGRYTREIKVPQYVPSSVPPTLEELVGVDQYSKLVRNIKQSNVSDAEKEFLIKAASRHLVFNYAKVADYYAHATPEMQKLMEESALVVIDINDAIANGYVKLSKTIRKIIEDSGESATEGTTRHTGPLWEARKNAR